MLLEFGSTSDIEPLTIAVTSALKLSLSFTITVSPIVNSPVNGVSKVTSYEFSPSLAKLICSISSIKACFIATPLPSRTCIRPVLNGNKSLVENNLNADFSLKAESDGLRTLSEGKLTSASRPYNILNKNS